MLVRRLAIAAVLAAVTPIVAVAAAPTVAVAASRHAAYGTLFVVNGSNQGGSPTVPSITEYAPGAHGDATPVATIVGSKTDLTAPGQAALTPSGWLLVADVDPDGAGVINEYAPGAHGNIAPARRILGPKTELDGATSVAVAPNAAIWVATMNTDPTQSGRLLEFAPGASGNVAPLRSITGSKTNLELAKGITVTPDGKDVWVSHSGETITGWNEAAVEEFATTANGNVAPVHTVAGPDIKLQFPQGVAVNPAGQLIVSSIEYASVSAGAVTTFAKNPNGDAHPRRFVNGSATGLQWSSGISLDATNNVWVANMKSNSVERFASDANGNAAPNRRIAGAHTGISDPVDAVAFVAPPTAPRRLIGTATSQRRFALSWRAPSSAGGGILDYRVYRKSGARGRWKLLATCTTRSYVAKHLAPSAAYQFRVTAENTAGMSKPSRSLRR